MDADVERIFLETLAEPYTGLPLVGAGGHLPAALRDAMIAVQFDGVIVTTTRPTVEGECLRFATQVPLEANAQHVQVVLHHDSGDRILATRALADLQHRPATAIPPQHLRGKLAGFLQRLAKSIRTGEAFSPSRWIARLDRFSESLLKQRQRLRHKRLARKRPPRPPHDGWIERTQLSPRQLDEQTTRSRSFRHRPVISILMPVFNVEPKWFRAAVQSVLAQSYERWELCIADDASSRVDLQAEFDRLPDDARIRFRKRPQNGHICAASNTAADLATGDYIALLDHDDALAPQALFEIVNALQSRPEADLLYSDEDKIDAKDHRYDPQFKPDWSPELLLSYNFINHFTVIRRRVFEAAGRFREGFEGSQDHDLLLRVTERTDRIVHVPGVLYHWRSLPTSTATSAGIKTYVHTSGRKAVEDALVRRGTQAKLVVPDFAQKLGLPVLTLDSDNESRSVAVIIHGDTAAARKTVQALKATTYRNCNHYLQLGDDAEALNRLAAARSEDDLVFVRAGATPLNPRWLHHLQAYARIHGVGAVQGATHRGEAISYYFYREVGGNFNRPEAPATLVQREHFERLGGLDAERFPQSLWLADLIARLHGQGLRTVSVGDAAFMLDSSHSSIDPLEQLRFRQSHSVESTMNPNLSDDFKITGDAGLIPVTAATFKLAVMAHNLNSPEGAPRYLSDIVLGLQNRKAVEPAVLSPTDGAGAQVYRTANVPVSVVNEPWAKHFIDGQWTPRTYEAAVNRLITELIKQAPDAVLVNTLLTFPMIEASARLGLASVWVIHESYSPAVLDRLYTPYVRHRIERAFGLASRIVPASHETADLFRRCDVRHNIRVIHNGIDPAVDDRFQREVSKAAARSAIGARDGVVQFVSVGTVCERKGQHTLVEAAAVLARTRRDFHVHIVGFRDAVPYGHYVNQLMTRHGVRGVVSLIPETDRVRHYLRAADAFVCTSHMETFSRSILEAEVFGLPILSTPCHGIGEQVVWNQNAMCFDINDAEQLARHMEMLLKNEDLRAVMGRKSRAVFDLHDSESVMLDRYQAVLQQAAGVRGEPVRQQQRLGVAA